MKLIIQYFRQAVRLFPKRFTASMLLILALTAMDTFIPWGLRNYLDWLIEENNYSAFAAGIVFFAGYLLIRVFVNIRWYISLDRFGGKYIEALSLQLERAMAETYYSEIERIKPGIVRNVLFTDVLNVFRVIGHHVPAMLGAFAVILGCAAISLAYNVKMTVFILAAAALGFLISWRSRKILAKTAGRTNAKLKQHDSWCTQFVELLPLIQTNNILGYYQERTSANLEEFVETSAAEDKKTIFWSGIVSGYHSLFSICLSALLAIPASGSSVTDLVFFTMLADIVMQQAQRAEAMFQQTVKLYVSFAHADELLNLPGKQGSEEACQAESLDFCSAAFSYPGKPDVLRDISCSFVRGDVVRLKGANGSGKSTFIKLITGLYQPERGGLMLNGRPIQQYSRESLNRQILYINQDERCLNESFRDYLEIITSRALTDEQYSELLSRAGLSGEERAIEGNGDSLSAGQRKKLFLLKFLLRREEASIIILDELTAGLDTETTRQIYTYLKVVAAKKDKIIFVVDHNLTDELDFTKNILFADGEITVS